MSNRTISLDDRTYEYLLAHSLREAPALSRLRAETASHPKVNMQIAPEQGQFMQLLVRLMGARRGIEVGVFTGYSSLAMMLAMPEDGRLLALDVSAVYTAVARRHWQEAGVADRVELRLAPAAETLAALPAEQTIDFAFVDADKESYPTYYEELVSRLRPGGLVLLDNVLLGGRVFDDSEDGERVVAMRAVNDRVAADDRVDVVMLPLRDGVTVARRR